MSQHLSVRHLSTISRIGDIYCPSHSSLPSFSNLGAIEHIDQVVGPLPEADLKDLKLLLYLLSFFPSFLLTGFVRLVECAPSLPTPIGTVLRMVRFGLRGIIFSLYYSGLKGASYIGPTPREIIGFKIQMK